jgi:hypothetical protein
MSDGGDNHLRILSDDAHSVDIVLVAEEIRVSDYRESDEIEHRIKEACFEIAWAWTRKNFDSSWTEHQRAYFCKSLKLSIDEAAS